MTMTKTDAELLAIVEGATAHKQELEIARAKSLTDEARARITAGATALNVGYLKYPGGKESHRSAIDGMAIGTGTALLAYEAALKAAEARAVEAEAEVERLRRVSEGNLWHRLWNGLGNEISLARGLSQLGETRFREILRSAISSTEAQS
jgi:hypothetical protein